MSDLAIRVEGLGKRYRIGQTVSYKTLRETVMSLVRAPLHRMGKGGPPRSEHTFWALRNINFEVRQGEVLGIIGVNGAGKSTLLKVLSRITEPTEGEVELRGRVGCLLEVGTGFHPELTGRENIFLNGAILGMTKDEINSRFEQIISFAEIGEFLDTPVKRYSSGMRIRLGFAVAAHLEPDILIVDEVLAVGDVAFQNKCLGKMSEVVRHGRTVLFVSHNMGAVRSLCSRVILLEGGTVRSNGDTDQVVNTYMATTLQDAEEKSVRSWSDAEAPGNEAFKLRKIELLTADGVPKSVFQPEEPIEVRIHYSICKPLQRFRICLQIRTAMGEIAFTGTDHSVRRAEHQTVGDYVSACRIPGKLLNLGPYVVRLWAGMPKIHKLLEDHDFIRFTVSGVANTGSNLPLKKAWPGVVCPTLDWSVRTVSPSDRARNSLVVS